MSVSLELLLYNADVFDLLHQMGLISKALLAVALLQRRRHYWIV